MEEILLDEKELTLALKEAWRDVYHSNPDFVQVCTPQTVATGAVVCRAQLRKVGDVVLGQIETRLSKAIESCENEHEPNKSECNRRAIYDAAVMRCQVREIRQALRAAAEEVRG